MKRWLAILLGSLAWFAACMPWGSFRDPDAFYHAKMSDLITRSGPLHAFPWLDLTTLGASFADQHLLLHVLVIPFQWIFGMLYGTQVAALILGSGAVMAFYAVLRYLRIRIPELWATLFFMSPPLVMRLTLGKASPLAVTLFVVGLAAVITSAPWLGFVAGLGFALSHGGWLLLLAGQGVLLIGQGLTKRVVFNDSWKNATLQLPWKTIGATWMGVVIGLVVHPNRATLAKLLWVQVVRIGIQTQFGRVFLGQEWLPAEVSGLLAITSVLLFMSGVVLMGLLFARTERVDTARMGATIGMGSLFACMLALTFKSQRFVEYLVPTWALFLALLAQHIDLARLRTVVTQELLRTKWAFYAVGVGLVSMIGQNSVQTFNALHTSVGGFHDDDAAVQAIQAHTRPGDRIMTSDWDEFPQLFATLDDRRYVSGLDPTFLLDANPHLSDEFRDVTLGRATSTLYTFIHDELHARAIFVTAQEHKDFDTALAHDARFTRIYTDPTIHVYQVQ